MKWNIGNVTIDNPIVMAPMAGIGNSAYRRICKEMGCGLICAEMVSDKAISYGNQKTIDMLYMTDEERPLAQQIFGSDKESFVSAAKFIYENMHPDIIDINMGCPVPKVALRAQAGAALLKNPQKIYEIVRSIVYSVPCPITVKIRSGWDKDHINAVDVAKVCEKAGASAIAVHGRTRSQGYSGRADWNVIKEVKESVNIPVIGNGDVKTPEDVKKMMDFTGCDAVMIGRGLLGNPWLIKNSLLYLSGKSYEAPSFEERIEMCKRHLGYLLEFKNDKNASLEIRSHIAWYLKGIPGSNEIKKKIFQTTSSCDILDILNLYEEELNHE